MITAIGIARKCIAEISEGWGDSENEKAARQIVGAIDAAIAAEREACAKIADDFTGNADGSGRGHWEWCAMDIATAIRARGKNDH